MKKLSDMQCVLLATAAGRDNGSLIPTPESITARPDRIRTAVAALIKAGYAVEGEVGEAADSWRQAGETLIGVRINDSGLSAIGAEMTEPGEEAGSPNEVATAVPPTKQTKTGMVIAMLGRNEGATLSELIAVTGWLPHTTRAALTGLRKKDHKVERGKRGEETLYRIAGAA